MRKRSTEKTINFKAKQKRKALPQVERIQNWLHQAERLHFFERPEGIRFTQKHYADDLEVLANQLYIIQAGTGLGTFKHDKFIPDHALALSNHLNRANVNCIPVTPEQALQYLRKENLLLNVPKGYFLLVYDGLILGWINGLGNRINNLYPVNWRIRMKA